MAVVNAEIDLFTARIALVKNCANDIKTGFEVSEALAILSSFNMTLDILFLTQIGEVVRPLENDVRFGPVARALNAVWDGMLRERNCNVSARPVLANDRLLAPAPNVDGNSDLENVDSTTSKPPIKLRIRLENNPRYSTCTIITYSRSGRLLIIPGVRIQDWAPKKQKSGLKFASVMDKCKKSGVTKKRRIH